jgi:FMN-dependent NADH-azoreductase
LIIFKQSAAFKAWIDLVARAKETKRHLNIRRMAIGLLVNEQAFIVIMFGGTKLDIETVFVSN